MNRSVPGLLHICCALSVLGCDLGKESVSGTAGEASMSSSADSGDEPTSGGDPSGTEDGDPSATEGGETSGGPVEPPCLDIDVGVESFDAPTTLGFTVDELLANIAGERVTTFGWLPPEGPVQLKNVPEPTPLTLTITYDGGSVRDINSAPNPDYVGDDIVIDCNDRIEIDMRLRIVTDDGQFDETIADVTFTAGTAEAAGFRERFEPHGFAGTFSVDDVMILGEGAITYFELDGDVRAEETNGSVFVEVILEEPIGGALFGTLGTWPAP